MNAVWYQTEKMASGIISDLESIYGKVSPVIGFINKTVLSGIIMDFTLLIVFGVLLYRWLAPKNAGNTSILSALKFLFPVEVYRHQSTRLDYWTVPINLVILFGIGAVFLTMTGEPIRLWLVGTFGESPFHVADGRMSVALQALIIFLAADFMFYIHHRLHHEIPLLWRFHRLHHSAEVLNPITAFTRIHPLEELAAGVVLGPVTAVLIGTLFYIGGLKLDSAALSIATGIGLVISFLHPFRHSHIWIAYPKFLSRVFCSPAMHHIHHSVLMKHRDKNYGTVLSLWDTMFGTAYIPDTKEEFPLGISLEERGGANPHPNIKQALVEPLTSAWRILRGPERAPSSSAADHR